MDYTQIKIETSQGGKVKTVFLNQPETYNSLNKKLLTELAAFISNCIEDENLRCIAISGRGKAFCSGQNLKDVFSLQDAENGKMIHNIVTSYYNPLVKAIFHCEKPVVALVNGPAVGAGAMLALICDICVAKESAYLSQAFSNIGLIPDTGGTFWLPKMLSRQQANYLAFTGKKLSANEAKSFGLIADVYADADFDEKSKELLSMIADQPTKALSLTKKAFNASYLNDLESQLLLEAELQQQAAETEDFREGVSAFTEKRKPSYKGR